MSKKYLQAMLAGFIGTVGMVLMTLLKNMMGLMKNLDPVKMEAALLHSKLGLPDSPLLGWMMHFGIGTVAWPIVFVLIYRYLPGKSAVMKGFSLSILAWFVFMIGPMPISGNGLFASRMDGTALVVMGVLVLHMVYGLILGWIYGRFAKNK